MNVVDHDPNLEALLHFLRNSRGFDFTGYKRPSLRRRILRRMETISVADFAEYKDYLEVHPEEFTELFNTILINITEFFRDAEAWDYLNNEIIPYLLTNREKNSPLRVWSAGCSSGEEAYSIAMVLFEALGTEQYRTKVKIYATDIDEEALSKARQAVYPSNRLKTVSSKLRDMSFESTDNGHVIRSDLRRQVIFGRHNLVEDAPISHVDLLLCRNTLMYFNADTQVAILKHFHFALNNLGVLFLGKAEMLLTHDDLFRPVHTQHRMFTKAVADLRLNHRNAASQLPLSPADHAMCVREAAIDTSPVAQAIVDMNGTLIIANERLRALFGIKAQDLGKPFQDLEFSYRPVELRSVIEQAYTERTMIEVGDFEHQMPNGTVRTLAVDVVPLHSKEGDLLGAHLLFQDRTKALKLEDDLRRINQELEAASEELQSTNEELETTNEELQSANEELETMNEELQSSNEELNALNAEVRHRSKESARLNILLQAILKSLPVGLLVVNKDMEIIMWNKHCEELWGLRTAEVMGCSLSSMDIGLRVDRLRKPIRDCLTNEGISIRLTVDAINRLGRSIQCRVTCTSFVGPSGEQVGVALILEDAACWPSDSDQEEATG